MEKYYKTIHTIAIGLFILIGLTCSISCDDTLESRIEPKIDVQEEVTIEPEGSREVIKLKSSYPWFAEASDSWIQLTRYRGQMQLPDSIVAIVAENTQMEAREGWIEVRLMDQMSKRIAVIQNGRGTLITLPKDIVYFNVNGGEAELSVLTNLNWDTDIKSENGFTFEKIDKNKLKVTVSPNNTGSQREIAVTLKEKGGDKSAILTVIQTNEEKMLNITLTPESKDVLLPKGTNEIEIPVITNLEYDLEISGSSWISVTSAPQFSGGDIAEDIPIKISVSANTSGVERNGYIKIRDKESEISDIYYISQMAKSRRVYVKAGSNGDGTSWENAFGDIESGNNACGDNDDLELWVAEGDYQLTGTIAFRSVNIYGGFTGNETKLKERNLNKKSTIIGGDFFLLRSEGASDMQYVFDGFILTGTNTTSQAEWGGVLRMTNRVFSNNIVQGNNFYRAACGYYDNCKIINCIFYNNTTTQTSGAIYFLNGTTVYNSNIVNNTVLSQWDDAYVIRAANNLKIYNSIIWGNTSNSKNNQYHLADASACSLYNCAVVNLNSASAYTPQANNCIINLSTDNNSGPLFIDPTNGNYQLQESSLLIDRGKSSIIKSLEISKDIIGNSRIDGNAVDIGAYEYQFSKVE